MIKVVRLAKPDVLVENETEWKKAIRDATNKKDREKAQDRYKTKTIKNQLVAMFAGKCAYCESKILHVDYGDIEHFKPKSVADYYELAVDWGNLLLACGRCNGAEHKGTKCPLANEGGPFIDPTADDPTSHFRFEYDKKTKLANVIGRSPRGIKTENELGLNRPDLLRQRSTFVKKLVILSFYYAINADAKALIDEAASPREEYSAFAVAIRSSITLPVPSP